MKRHAWWIGTSMALALMTLLSVGRQGPAGASSLSRTSSGWSAARWYLEEMGSEVRTLDAPITGNLREADVLVVTGSTSSDVSTGEAGEVERFVRRGGRLVLGYGLRSRSSALRKRLGLSFADSAARPRSLNPLVWMGEASNTDRVPLGGSGPLVAVGVVREHPIAGPGDEVLVRNAQGESLVLLRPLGDGEILLLPDDTFSNGRLKEPGNSALLEGLRVRFGEEGPWAFDEYHHGVASAASPSGIQSRRGLDLFIFQILLAYGLFVAALGRRFGPEWPEPAPASGATGAFLTTIAGIHDRLGHHRDAAQALQDRAHEVLGVAITPLEAPAPDSAGTLVEVARRIHAKQKEGRTP